GQLQLPAPRSGFPPRALPGTAEGYESEERAARVAANVRQRSIGRLRPQRQARQRRRFGHGIEALRAQLSRDIGTVQLPAVRVHFTALPLRPSVANQCPAIALARQWSSAELVRWPNRSIFR